MFRRAITALVVAGFSLSLAAPPAVSAKKKTGKLRVVVTGTGSYQVIGKGIKRKSTKTKTFKLPVGKYRIKAKGATIKPRKVTVKKNKTRKAKVTFTTAPTPTPTPKPTPTPTPTPPRFTPGAVQRASASAAGTSGDDISFNAAWSPDGSRIAFYSYAENLVPGDTNGSSDLFVKTLATGAIQRVSTNESGAQGNALSFGFTTPSWSPDGTKIAFTSLASNLVGTDTNGVYDIYVKDLTTGAIQRISTDNSGGIGNSMSIMPSWSPDGTRVAFLSSANNLVSGDTNGLPDLFVKTLATGAIQRASTNSFGEQLPASPERAQWSPDSRRLLFNVGSSVFIKNLATGEFDSVADGEAASWSPDGKRIVYTSALSDLVPGDTNGAEDVFVQTLSSGAIQRVSTSGSGGQANRSSASPAWSPDGNSVVFTSTASNLVAGDTNATSDVFVKNLTTGAIQRISTTSTGSQVTGHSFRPAWSPDGFRVAFDSEAELTPGRDPAATNDVYVKVLP